MPPLKSTIHTTSSLVSISSPKTIPLRAFKQIPYYLYLAPFLNCVRSSIGNSQRLQFTLQHSTLDNRHSPIISPPTNEKRGTQAGALTFKQSILRTSTLPSLHYRRQNIHFFLLAFRRSDNSAFNILISSLLFTLQLNHQHIVISARAARVLLSLL